MRPRVVFGLCALLVVVALPLAVHQGDHLTADGFALPGSDSRVVWRDLERGAFPSAEPSRLAVVLVPRPDTRPVEMLSAVARTRRAARAIADVELSADANRLAVAAAGHPRTTVVPLRVAVGEDRATHVALALRAALPIGKGAHDGVTMHLVGPAAFAAAFQEISKHDVIVAETVSLPLLALILIGVFGSLAAASLPLALGVATVALAGGLIYALSHLLHMYVFVSNVASMVGLGVAVDYSLFVLARYRQEARAGKPLDLARATAMKSAGVAVAFSGLAVVVSLSGVLIINSNAIRSVALGAIIVVAVAVLATWTLLPAVLDLLGPRLLASRKARRGGEGSFWERWTGAVIARPGLSGLAALACLALLALPALGLRIGTGALRELGHGNEARVGFERAAEVVGAGNLAPVHIELSFERGRLADAGNRAAADAIVRRIAADREVAQVTEVVPGRDGRSLLVTAAPRSEGESEAAKALVGRLRSTLPASREAKGLRARVGGIAAGELDFQNLVESSIWKVAAIVSFLAFLILIPVLRSLLLPLKAALLTLLSLAAAYGVLVVVFQWGWFDGLFGYRSPGYVNALALPLTLALVVGLSMDYEVLLMLRMRERYAATGDGRAAIAGGLALSARAITSAALIMVAVFAAFVGTGVTTIKQIGLGNAVAIGLDATLVRLVLVPAAMVALGRWNWWLPDVLRRLLGIDPLPEARG